MEKRKSENKEKILISIITPSYNQGEFIEKNILSVINQNYDNVEHMIIDGGSTDNTIKILKKYPHLKWVSEPDEGQADALNKGLAMATGEIIGWINSDDYYEENIFENIVKEFKDNSVNWIVGNITYVWPEFNHSVKKKSPTITYKNLIKNPDIVRQQCTFFRKSILNEVGGFNKKFYMTMDYDIWIKLSKISNPVMTNKTYAYFTHHPEQKSTIKNLIVQIRDINTIYKKEGINFTYRIFLLRKKYWYLLKGYLKITLIYFKLIDERNKKISHKELKKLKK